MITNPIQTPLISQEYRREILLKRFTVVSDSLAPIMRRGYDLHCLTVRSVDSLKADDLLVIECRVAGRKRVSYQVGFFRCVSAQALTLDYNDQALKTAYPNWSIPLHQIKRVWEVDKIVRWYTHIRKFYPYARYGK